MAMVDQRCRLDAARFIPPNTIVFKFADGRHSRLDIRCLEVPLDRILWRTAAAAPDGASLLVTAIKGELIPIAAGTIRYLVDPKYAAEIDAHHQELLYSEAESRNRDEPPPHWFTQAEADVVLESWK